MKLPPVYFARNVHEPGQMPAAVGAAFYRASKPAMSNLKNFPTLTEQTLAVSPIERSQTIPSDWYINPEFHQIDSQAVFLQTWQWVGHLGKVANPGDYFLASVADNPLILLRDRDGALRGFYNVCRHRGGPLATDESGNCTMLQCKYHGWTYRLDGALRGVPKFDRVELFNRDDYGLIPIAVAVWEGLIFVHLGEQPPPIATVVEGIAERIAPISLLTKRFFRRVEYRVECNWKIYIDNYLEGYHVPLVHPELMKMLDFNSYITETARWYSLQFSPIRPGGDHPYGGAAVESAAEAFYYFIYPNFMLNILPGRLQTNLVIPVSHNRTLVRFDYFYDDIKSPEALSFIQEDIASSDRIQAEDIDICQRVQRGVASRAYDRGRFSVECEQGVYHFQSLLKESYRRWISR